MPSEEVNEATRREWRELGFFYDRNDETKEWLIRGSRQGLLAFAKILEDYSRNPNRRTLSEHDHLGPYMYLEIGTWNSRVIDDHWIAGTQEDLAALAVLIREHLAKAQSGNLIQLREAYAPVSLYELVLEICGDDFDPAKADKGCW
jgi:hypothetical protein